MCGRMTLSKIDWVQVTEELLLTSSPQEEVQPRFNVAPTHMHPIVVAAGDANTLALAQWGFSGTSKGPLVINARSESAAAKPMFRDAIARHRCVVVADGFIEWRKTPIGRQPVWFQRKAGPIYFAGLYTPMGSTAKESPLRFVVLTTAANHTIAPVHDRMPTVLSAHDACAWLAAPKTELLRPAPDEWLRGTPVSSRINNTANDDPACLAPNTQTREQLALF